MLYCEQFSNASFQNFSDEESLSHWQQKDYKTLSPTISENPDYAKFPAIQSVPITSAICEPKNGSSLKVSKDGSAFSIDGGKTWQEAELERAKDHVMPPRSWSWVLWKVKVPVSDGKKEIDIVSRAVDSTNNVQPESYSATWDQYHKTF